MRMLQMLVLPLIVSSLVTGKKRISFLGVHLFIYFKSFCKDAHTKLGKMNTLCPRSITTC